MLPRILILVPYFGPWPEWIEFFLATCRWNSTIDWVFFSDAGPPGRLAVNLRYVPMTLTEFSHLAHRSLGCAVTIRHGYKVCDFRLAFGQIFEEYVRGYDCFGWSDVDVVYGDLRHFLTPAVLEHDVITFNERHLSGHLTFVRNNSSKARTLHSCFNDFATLAADPEHHRLDEPHPNALRGYRVYAVESFNTPLSKLNPWRSGQFVFPKEWQWEDGVLTNDLDDDTRFLYLHFMHWKGGSWPRSCGNGQWERLNKIVHLDPAKADDGFRINDTGFHKLLA